MQRATLHTIARLFVALLFLGSGGAKIATFGTTAEMMAQMSLPLPILALSGAILLEIAGGLLLLSGIRLRATVIALIVFLVPTTLIFHVPFVFNPEQWQTQLIQVLKNLAIIGALLELYLHAEVEEEEQPVFA